MSTLAEILPGTPFAEFVAQFESRDPLPPLAPQSDADLDLTARINSMSPAEILGKEASGEFAQAVKSGLLLWNDALEISHKISQEIPSPTGSYWHAIMHRREPDYSNSKYWFRRVGDHPCFSDVREAAIEIFEAAETEWAPGALAEVKDSEWDAFRFVDWCEGVDRTHSVPEDSRALLQQIQIREIAILLDYSVKNA